jgi:hypothetical protein
MARTLIVESGPLQAIVLGFPRVDAIDAPGGRGRRRRPRDGALSSLIQDEPIELDSKPGALIGV